MSNLNLFCLTDREPMSNAFPVKILSTETVDSLKGLIKANKTPEFDNVAADKLMVWRVSVPVVAANIRNAVFLNEIDYKTELVPKTRLSKVFTEEPPKKSNPHHCEATTARVLDKEPTSDRNETLRGIVESDLGKINGHRVVTLIGPSGSGKTATVVDLAKTHFVIYCVCCDPSTMSSPDFKDPNFVTLAREVEKMCGGISRPELVSLNDLMENDSTLKRLVGDRVELEFLSRLLFLQLLINNNPDLEPLQFFHEQINEGAETIWTLVNELRAYEVGTIRLMRDHVQNRLADYLAPRIRGLMIALDEAHVAGTRILADKFIAPSALGGDQEILDGRNHVQVRFRRGFLTPLSATLSNMRATLVLLGTALSLQDADQMYSAIGKRMNFTKITCFPSFDEGDVGSVLSGLVDISDCELPPAKCQELMGRPRFSLSVINKLIGCHSDQESKQTMLDEAIDSAIENVLTGLRSKVRSIIDSDKTGETVRLVGRMVLAYEFQGGKISFASISQFDFVDKALCRLQSDPDGTCLIMSEPLVVKAVKKESKISGVDPAFLEYLDQFQRIVTNFGVNLTAKGDALEPLVRRSLQRFNGFRIADLPFLKGIALPTWCDRLELQIDDINTASEFRYRDSVQGDLDFLTARPKNKLLIEQFGTRRDGVWFFSDNRYAGSIVIKFYSKPVPQTMHKENETSRDIRCSFLKKDGISLNPQLENIRRAFEASGTPGKILGILRIHLEFPGVKKPRPITCIKVNPATGIEDVMVYIDSSNMNEFFYEGIKENEQDIRNLKRLIEYVLTK
ncbi:hypothetical protein BGZ54_009410 [Gamsiella multidivaricata]|nr:hypothetical protein BGZ54_009410 [Gamsiella multidivaricata]